VDPKSASLPRASGRAVFPIDADDPDGLLRAADAAMFGVKRETRAFGARSMAAEGPAPSGGGPHE
jgi:hypothetical protein